MSETYAVIPGLIVEPPKPRGGGPVEAGTIKALATLRAGGWVTDAHAHLEALALATARKFDSLPEREKAYGYAQVTQALTKVFEMLPTPEAGQDQQWTEFMKVLADSDGTSTA